MTPRMELVGVRNGKPAFRPVSLNTVRLPLITLPWLDDRPKDICGRRRSKATMSSFRKGRKPANAGKTSQLASANAPVFHESISHRRKQACGDLQGFRTCAITVRMPICENCNADFTPHPNAPNRDAQRYCSRTCGITAAQHANTGRVTPWQERFWRFVPEERGEGCWLWTGQLNGGGYGKLMTEKPTTMLAHRASWAIHNGGVVPPSELKVCHSCDVRACVNPAHLFLGTQADNVADMNRKGRHARLNGERVGTAKYTDEQVDEVRRLAASGLTQGDISRRTGVSVAAVKNYRRGFRPVATRRSP